MPRSFRRHLNPSLVVSFIALFVALSGASYAAFKLPARSVGKNQLRAGAVTNTKLGLHSVTGSKIATHAVTGAKIGLHAVTASKVNVAGFPTVPSATHASTADSATTARTATTANTATNATHLGGRTPDQYALSRTLQPTSAALQNGWLNGSGPTFAGYAKDQFGIVHLFGFVTRSQTTDTSAATIFTLPVGLRPLQTVEAVAHFGSTNDQPGLVHIDPDGDVRLESATFFVELEGITFSVVD